MDDADGRPPAPVARAWLFLALVEGLTVLALSVLFFVRTQDAMLLVFGTLAAGMAAWATAAAATQRADAGRSPAAQRIVMGLMLAIGAAAVLVFVRTLDLIPLLLGVIGVAMVHLATRRRA